MGILENLPSELQYIAAPAMKYGIHQLDDEIYRFLENASAEELNELSAVAGRMRVGHHNDVIGDFLDRFPITDYAESANLYFLFAVMDAAGLQFLDDDWNTLESRISSLGKFGSYRLASKRMNAARFLAEFGDRARAAIPALQRALNDEDLRVRVWAHYALAVISRQCDQHEAAIRKIYSAHAGKDALGCHDDVGGEASAALEKMRELKDRTGGG